MLPLPCMAEARETSSGHCAAITCGHGPEHPQGPASGLRAAQEHLPAGAAGLPLNKSSCQFVGVWVWLCISTALTWEFQNILVKYMHPCTACLSFPICKGGDIKETPAVVRADAARSWRSSPKAFARNRAEILCFNKTRLCVGTKKAIVCSTAQFKKCFGTFEREARRMSF